METDVIVVGAGPVGLMLAAELRLQGVETLVIERLPKPTGHSKAAGLHPRSVETMELRGLVSRFQEYGQRGRAIFGNEIKPGPAGRTRGIPLAHFAGIRTIRLDRLDTNHPAMLAIPQANAEELLAERAAELGAQLRRGHDVVGLCQDQDGVNVEVAGPHGRQRLRAAYLVGCDGGRSTVRRLAGFDFPGTSPTLTCRLGDVVVPELFDTPGSGWHRTATGVIQITPRRVLTVEFNGPPSDRDAPMTVAELAASASRVVGRPVTIPGEPGWMSRFTDNTRHATEYRRGRVLLAGDAAHVHAPFGGQGLNLGLQDAVNLGWKLASVVRGQAPESLLDSYHAERHPVAEAVLHNTRAQSALVRPGPQTDALRDVFNSLIVFDDVNRYLVGMLTGLDIRYPVDGKHQLVGRRVPDADLKTPGDATRVYELLHAARPVLLDLRGSAEIATAAKGWADRVDLIEARSEDDRWPVPAVGEIPAPAALLIRPDGHVAWVAEAGGAPDTSALRTALTTWFGPALQG
jgi:2-polyprenyl-6-methoxyphenol hydroxylase-like FAD-dependent oxidoreductase